MTDITPIIEKLKHHVENELPFHTRINLSSNEAQQILKALENKGMITDKEIEDEASEVNAPKDEKGRTIFFYSYDDDQQDAFIEGAKWMRDKFIHNLNLKEGGERE